MNPRKYRYDPAAKAMEEIQATRDQVEAYKEWRSQSPGTEPRPTGAHFTFNHDPALNWYSGFDVLPVGPGFKAPALQQPKPEGAWSWEWPTGRLKAETPGDEWTGLDS